MAHRWCRARDAAKPACEIIDHSWQVGEHVEWRVRRPGSFGVAKQHAAAEAHQEQRFGQYVLPELEPLLRLALSLASQPADAEDLVQDTVLRAYRSIERFDGQGSS